MERELWNELYRIVVSLDTFAWRGLYRNWEIVVVYFWAVVHDRPVSWACERRNWQEQAPRHLPSQPTLSRRMRSEAVRVLLEAVESHLRGEVRSWWVQRIDSKPLPVGCFSKDRQARWGRAGRAFARGYKLHAIYGRGRLPRCWRIESMNTGDARAARKLFEVLSDGGGYVVGDCQYDSNPLHVQANAVGYQIVAAQKRRGQQLGHRRHDSARLHSLEMVSRPFGQALLEYREDVERIFGALTCTAAGLGPLPAWVRSPPRVQLWVQAKLILHAIRQTLQITTATE